MSAWARVAVGIDSAVERLFRWDKRMVETLSENHVLRRLSPLFLTATILGDGYIWGGLGLGLILFGRPIDRVNVLIGLAVLIVNIAMFRFLKLLFERPRPIPVEDSLRSRLIDTYSFPSGHATTSFGLVPVSLGRGRDLSPRLPDLLLPGLRPGALPARRPVRRCSWFSDRRVPGPVPPSIRPLKDGMRIA